ncbi:MAG: cytidine deaminase [Deltaproteobacteria bacterium]|nr:cytidine deaminase [Deltaproteobacteria bacterium]
MRAQRRPPRAALSRHVPGLRRGARGAHGPRRGGCVGDAAPRRLRDDERSLLRDARRGPDAGHPGRSRRGDVDGARGHRAAPHGCPRGRRQRGVQRGRGREGRAPRSQRGQGGGQRGRPAPAVDHRGARGQPEPDAAFVSADEDALVAAAWAVREHAYAPYSRFRVGAAVRGASGRIYVGANVENAAYPVGACAERSAVCAAVSAGERQIVAVGIATDTDAPVSPCGLCRQTLREFGADMEVVLASRGDARRRMRLSDLLPMSFGPEDLAADDGAD